MSHGIEASVTWIEGRFSADAEKPNFEDFERVDLVEAYEGRLCTKCSTRRFVMAFHRFGTSILRVESLLSEFDSSNGQFDSTFYEVDSSFCEVVSSTSQFDSSAGLFDSSFYEFDSSLTTSVCRPLSFCRFDVSFRRFDSSTSKISMLILLTAFHALHIFKLSLADFKTFRDQWPFSSYFFLVLVHQYFIYLSYMPVAQTKTLIIK